MKAILRISICLNLVLLGSVIFLLASQRRNEAARTPALSESKPPTQTAALSTSAASPQVGPEPFRWSQLESTKDYRIYVANLRAMGCPEPTVEDIVRGDTARAFSWERSQLGLDESGTGPWSRRAEMQLVASLLGGQPPAATVALAKNTGNQMPGNGGGNEATVTTASLPAAANQARENVGGEGEIAQIPVPSQNAKTAVPSYPLFLQNVNWSALGFNADQQAAITQVRQQFQNEVNGLSQNPNNSASQNSNPANSNSGNAASLTQWQTALQNADYQLRALLGNQAYNTYVQQQYWYWYQPQVVAADAAGTPLAINPGTFSLK